MLKIRFQKAMDKKSYLLQWLSAQPEGQEFSAYLSKIGRRFVTKPEDEHYLEISFLAMQQTELDQIRTTGAKGEKLVDLIELLPGKKDGESFSISFDSFEKKSSSALDIAMTQQQAGDFLHTETVRRAALKGISYSKAFTEISRENPRVYDLYQ